MKKLIILIVLLLALIPFVSHAQQGFGEHHIIGEFEVKLLDNHLYVTTPTTTVVMAVTTRKNKFTEYTEIPPRVISVNSIYYYGELVATIVDHQATLISTPWLELEPVKASH